MTCIAWFNTERVHRRTHCRLWIVGRMPAHTRFFPPHCRRAGWPGVSHSDDHTTCMILPARLPARQGYSTLAKRSSIL